MQAFKSVFTLLGISIVGFIMQCGLNMYLAHDLGNFFYGQYSLALKVLALFIHLILFGTDIGAQSFLAKYLNANKNSAQDYLRWNMKVIGFSIVSTRIVAVLLLSGLFLGDFFGVSSIRDYSLFIQVLWIAPTAALFLLFTNFLNSQNIVFTSVVLTHIVSYLVQFLFFFAALHWLQISVDNLNIVVVLAFSNILLSLLATFFLKKEFMHMLLEGFLHMKKVSVCDARWFRASIQLILSRMIFFFTMSVDLIIVKFVSRQVADVAHYAAILTITSFVWYLSGNLYLTLKPTLSLALTTKKGRLALQQQLNDVNKLVFVILTLISMAILCFSTPILLLFGPDYVQAQPALICLTLGGWFFGISQFSGTILLYAGFESFVCRVVFIRLVCMLLLMVPATYWFGITGAAMVASTVFIISYLVFLVFVKRKLGICAIYNPYLIRSVSRMLY